MNSALLSLSFLLFAFTAKLSLATDEAVYDIDGDELVPGSKYYVLPHIWPAGGRVALAKTGNQTHAVSVTQERHYSNNGQAIIFTTLSKKEAVHVNRALEISFAERPHRSKWLIVNDLNDAWSVGSGTAKEHPDHDVLTGYFKIKSYASFSYTLYFQPLVNSASSGDIGRIQDDEGYVHLAVVPREPFLSYLEGLLQELAESDEGREVCSSSLCDVSASCC